jgi:CRP-like cAMP-binding protein
MLSLKTFTDNYKDLPEESIASFINLATIVEFKKNEVITKTGEISNDFYIIKSGIVRSFYADEKGKEYTRTIFTEGKTTGSLGSLVSGESSKLTYECLTDCVAYKFIYREFLALTEKDNFMLKLYNKMLENIFLMMEARIYELSVLNATQRYLKLKGEIPNIETLIPQYHIASYLNVTAVQLSRIRKEIYSK